MKKNTSGFKNSILKWIKGGKTAEEDFEHIQRPEKLVFITGTKGKTTVLKLVGHVLRESGRDFMWNISGEDETERPVSVLRAGKSVSGQSGCGLALMEVDEREIRHICSKIPPDLLVYTNAYSNYWDQKGSLEGVEKGVDMSAFENIKMISNEGKDKIVSVDTAKMTLILQMAEKMEIYRLLGCTKADLDNEVLAIELLYQLGLTYEEIAAALDSAEPFTICLHMDTVGSKKVFMCRGEEQSPAVCAHVLEWIGKQSDDCAVVLMDYKQKEQVRASENTAWLYEVDYTPLKRTGVRQVLTAGNRCYDYWLRLLLAGIHEERVTCALWPEDVVKLADIDEVENIYMIFTRETRAKAEEIKEHLLQRIKKEEGIK